jgi:hypothetical protein
MPLCSRRRISPLRILPMLVVAFSLVACSSDKTNKTEPLPAECSELADLLTKCFASTQTGEMTRRGFPVIQKGDEAALSKLEGDCRRNLKDLKGDCR